VHARRAITSVAVCGRPITAIPMVAPLERVGAMLLIDVPPRSDAAEYLALARSLAMEKGTYSMEHPRRTAPPAIPSWLSF